MCLGDNLLSRFSRSDVHVALLSSGLGALRAARRARDVILRAQIEMWRVQNRRKTCPNKLSASVFEALEVSETPRSDQESLKEVSESSKVTIHRACRVIMSSPGATTDIDPASAGLRRTAAGLRRGCGGPSTEVIFSVDVVP